MKLVENLSDVIKNVNLLDAKVTHNAEVTVDALNHAAKTLELHGKVLENHKKSIVRIIKGHNALCIGVLCFGGLILWNAFDIAKLQKENRDLKKRVDVLEFEKVIRNEAKAYGEKEE